MFCAHLYNIFLRGEGTLGFINGVGWTFMGASALNILINMAIVIFDTVIEAGEKYVQWKQHKRKLQVIRERRENREEIVKEAPGAMKVFEFELSIYEVLSKVKSWLPHRKWLVKNKVKFDDYPEEIEFQKLLSEYKLIEKAQYGRMSKVIASVAERQASIEIEKKKVLNQTIK